MAVVMVFMYSWIQIIEKKHRVATETNSYLYNYSATTKRYHRFLYPALSGIIGAQSVVFAKSTVELIKFTVEQRSLAMFRYIQPYCIVASMALCVVLQVRDA